MKTRTAPCRPCTSLCGIARTAASAAIVGATAVSAPLIAAELVEKADRAPQATERAPAPSVGNGTIESLKAKGKRIAVKATGSYAPIDPAADSALPPELELHVGESRVFPTPGVARIAVGNGQVMTATALDDKQVIIFGNAVGTSSLLIWNEDGRYQRLKVTVGPGDTTRIAREVAVFLSRIPKATASVVGDNVIVEGDELSNADREKLQELAKRYPQIVNFTSPIGWEQMVLMDVKVVEFPKTELRELGLKWSTTGGAAIGAIWTPSGRGDVGGRKININSPSGAGAPITTPSGVNEVTLPSNLTVMSAINMGLNAQLNLLEQNGSASVLAEPQLSTRSGYKSSFLAGGELPYSVATVNGVTVQYKPYGIKLEIEPRVGQNGIVRAVIESEVSSIDTSVTAAAGPALLTRKTKTEFNVRAGETIVLSGLLQRSSSNDFDKVPLLGDIPILGALFRSKRFQNKETELVIFVTPRVVDSHDTVLAERVQRVDQRLEQRLGAAPYLSDPLQAKPALPSTGAPTSAKQP